MFCLYNSSCVLVYTVISNLFLTMSLQSDKYLTLYVQFWAPDNGRKTRLQHVQRLTEINKLWNAALCWLYAANILAMLNSFPKGEFN